MSNIYNYYPTPASIVADIFSYYKGVVIENILDLGSGKGDLTKPFLKYNNNLKVESIELDKTHFKDLKELGTRARCYDLVLKSVSKDTRRTIKNTSSLILSNPPFSKTQSSTKLLALLKHYGLWSERSSPLKLRTELIFIARALEAAAINSDICLILPFSFLTSPQYRTARETLSSQHCLSEIHIHPDNSFQNTEVRSITIFLKAHIGTAKKIKISDGSDNTSYYVESGEISITDKTASHGKKLNDLGITITRGKNCAKNLREKNVPHIHSNDIVDAHGGHIRGSSLRDLKKVENEMLATTGDILISRVGSRCIGKVARIISGNVVLSDSVMRLRLPKDLSKPVLEFLTSTPAQCYFAQNARGSCAKILTYDTIRNMPIQL